MTITAWLIPFPDGSGVLAVGFLEGLTGKPLVVFAPGKTAMGALSGLFAQAKSIEMVTAAARRWPLMPIEVN